MGKGDVWKYCEKNQITEMILSLELCAGSAAETGSEEYPSPCSGRIFRVAGCCGLSEKSLRS